MRSVKSRLPVFTPAFLTVAAVSIVVVILVVSRTDEDSAPGSAIDGATAAGARVTPGGTLAPGTTTPAPGAAAPTPTVATPVGVQIEVARRLESEGDLFAAAQAYLGIAVVAGPDQAEAVLGAARLLIEIDQPEDARDLLEDYLADAPAAEAAPAHYLLGRAYAALDLTAPALAAYDTYVAAGGPAVPYAHFARANLLAESGRPAAAATEAQLGLAFELPPATRNGAVLAVARSLEQAGAPTDALVWYDMLRRESGSAVDQALALRQIGTIKRTLGDATYLSDFGQLLASYPSSPHALATVEELGDAGQAVDPYMRGLVYYRHNRYDEAGAAFDEQIGAAADAVASAESYYYRAAIFEARGDLETAHVYYSRVLDLNPLSVIADDSLWWRARLHEDAGETATAGELLAQLVRDYPASAWAAEAAFRAGLLAYRDGRFVAASVTWAEGLLSVTDSTERQRIAFWQGKALLLAGDPAAARTVLQPLTVDNQDDYYGVRALSLLAGAQGQPQAVADVGADLAPAFDWPAAEAWLASLTGRPVVDLAATGLPDDQRWRRAEELRRVGDIEAADAEAFAVVEAYASDPIVMYALARTLADQGRVALSARAGQRLLRVLDTNPNAGLPQALLSLSYPPAYPAIVERYASDAGVSPLLMLAFIRQESFFDPRAESPVGALGLTQVLPTTARSLAQRLGLPAPAPAELKEADTNVHFGASYMAEQLASFDDDVFSALAAYNAGPSASSRWAEGSGGDADLYVELVEFTETRHYIEFVAENYAIYRYLYGGAATPSLPAD